jgi:putative pyruvate formate lyase activating enzyme
LRGERGFCGAGREAELFLEYVHWGEDADIVPAQTLYLTGCNLTCRFCQTGEEQRRPTDRLTPELFRQILARGRRAGARTVNILGGEPTVNLPALLELFAAAGDFPGLVWNTNLYGSAEAFRLLDGLVDVYLADLKFGSSGCAETLAGAGDAGETAQARAAEIFARAPAALIARHLVVPGHFDCCTRPVLEWIARRLPGVRVSLKTVYLPPRTLPAACREKRFLTPEEAAEARRLAESLRLRLTRDAPWPEAPGLGETEPGGRPAPVEAVIAPDGRGYLRHIGREAAEVLKSLEARP